MSARRGGGARVAPWIIPKKKVLKNVQKHFNLQKAPIVMRGTFTTKGPHVMRYIFT